MKHPRHPRAFRLCLARYTALLAVGLGLLAARLPAQTLTWDTAPASGGVQNGNGTWNTTVANWIDSVSGNNVLWTNSGLEVAQFGSTTPANPSVVTVSGNMNLKGLVFLPLGITTPVAGNQYSINGSAANTVLNFGDGGYIEMADFSSGGSQFAALGANIAIQGSNLTIRKTAGSGTVTQFLNLNMASNPNLTGTLTIGSYIYLGVTSQATIGNVSSIVVQTNGTLTLGPTNATFNQAITAAGYAHAYGAIRILASNVTLSGGITMTGDMGILTHSSNTGILINSAITDGGNGYAFHRYSLTKNDGTFTLTAANTYGGKTVLGRNMAGYTGGITILDFAATGAPVQDILYNGLTTAGGLEFAGSPVASAIGSSLLILNGKAGTDNVQRFGNVSVTGLKGDIQVNSGAGGSMTLQLGTITRTGAGMISFTGPVQGSITTTTVDGFLGPWATYKSGTGYATWAQVSSGVVTGFTGSTTHATGVAQASNVATHLTIGSTSTGVVTPEAAVSYLATVSMTDTASNRTVAIGNGNTLRLAAVGGVQIASDARNLTIGELGVSSFLSAGGSSAGAGQLYLTNNSTTSLLTIHSGITNNAGGGAVNVLINGASGSTTVLTGTGSYTGGTTIASGALEIRNGAALGTSGLISVQDGASLRLSGGITLNRAVTLSGIGTSVAVEGALRNVSGDNTISGLITQLTSTTISSDAGTLRLQAATAATNAITGTFAIAFGGRSNIIVDGRINVGTGGVTKTGNGTLILNGDNNFTGNVTINGGVVRVGHVNALGNNAGTFSLTDINTGGTLELTGGLTLSAEPISLGSTGFNNTGGIRNGSGDNTLTGLITVDNTSRIESQSGTLTLDVASGNAIIKDNSGSNRSLTFGGAGNIVVLDAIARQNTGAFTVTKDGTGTLILKAVNTYDGATTVNAGEMHLDYTGLATPTNLLYNGLSAPGALRLAGGTLRLTGKTGGGVSTSQHFGNFSIGIGMSNLKLVQNGGAGVTVDLGNLARGNSASILQIDAVTDAPDTTGTGGPINLTTTGGVDNAIISHDGIVSFTWGKSDWAATTAKSGDRRRIVGLSSIEDGYTAGAATSLAGNADVVMGAGVIQLSDSTDITSLRFNAAQSSYLGMGTGVILTTGGILVGEGVGANTTYIDGGILRSASTGTSFDLADLVVIQNNTQGDLVISSVIANNATAASQTTLTKAGVGTVVLETAVHTFTGTVSVVEGTLWLKSGSINSGTQFTIGGGAASGKLKVGNNTASLTLQGDWLRTEGYGTANAVVGGGTFVSKIVIDFDALVSDFRRGTIGGTGLYENNIGVEVSANAALLQLGANNTYAGRTTIQRGIVEVETLANTGQTSSLGTGDFGGDASNSIIYLAGLSSGSGLTVESTLRYVGSTNSVTNRSVQINNNGTQSAIAAAVGIIENTGTGTLQFTSLFTAAGTNTNARKLRLTGTNAGDNRIVGISDVDGTIKTQIEKTGVGTWGITGSNTYSGGTAVTAGILQALNTAAVGTGSGSATGTGMVTVAAGGTLAGTGRVAPAAGNHVTVSGKVSVGDATLAVAQASRLEIATSGSGVLTFKTGSTLALDLFTGVGLGNNDGVATASDVMVVNGSLVIESGATLVLGNPNQMMEWTANDSWKLFDWSGLSSRTGEFSVLSLPALGGGLSWDTSKLYVDGTIAVTAVPEPGRMMLLVLAAGVVGWRRRRGGSSVRR
ncbi:autotransporter-associated beta strand repeat-containing protein [Verrucomicrobium sp. BvORR034]|uniref:beta strand repeat-containing protein n=1 Tax=Verrucomicrobium sp. BvORR034 TaxID=1396418 RepID=UPI0022410091|nr:autotransporter-associated beta strand repeat-containing protein [Verrucomicrobium sp. BvORR034]